MILSGGQTGVDRAALDAALDAGIACGGWCPAGRKAEYGPIPARYPLRELAGAGYIARTRKNVEDSGGTLIVTFGAASGGTRRTIEFAQRFGKPLLIIDGANVAWEEAVQRVAAFVCDTPIVRLNVAGPRASGVPRGYAYVRLCFQSRARVQPPAADYALACVTDSFCSGEVGASKGRPAVREIGRDRDPAGPKMEPPGPTRHRLEATRR